MDFTRYINEDTFRPLTLSISLKYFVSSLYGEVKTYLIATGACGNETAA
jgi:hypothetical protein